MPDQKDTEETFKKLTEKLDALPPKNDPTVGKPETYTEQNFIEPLLSSLGWNASSTAERRFQRQYTVQGVVRPTWEDYALIINGHPMVFIEVKSVYEKNILSKYKAELLTYLSEFNKNNHLGIVIYIGVLTNFKETYFFRTGDETPFGSHQTPDLDIKRLISWLSPEGVESSAMESAYQETLKQPLDRLFLQDLKKWRLFLANGYYRRQKTLTKDELKMASQKLLDRLILIRMLESRNVLPPQWIRSAYSLWLREITGFNRTFAYVLRESFRSFESLYNTELFKDDLCDRLEIDDKFLEEVIKVDGYNPDVYKMCGMISPGSNERGIYGYNFAAMTLDVIGSVYERYLAHDIVLKGEVVEIEETKELRKKEGAYYTPWYIVSYIVESTLKPRVERVGSQAISLLREHRFSEAESKILELGNIKVLDPACGSGSFLIKSFDVLAEAYDEYNNTYTSEESKYYARSAPSSKLVEVGVHAVKDVGTQILLDNIYGVDLDPQAVELTKLNLWIRVFSRYPELYRRAQKKVQKKELPRLEMNVKCGNSMITGIIDLNDLKAERDKLTRLIELRRDVKETILSRSPEHAKTLNDKSYEELKIRQNALVAEEKTIREDVNDRLNDRLIRRELKEATTGYFDDLSSDKPFNWEVEFAEIFGLDAGQEHRGFDCIVGNPPYISLYNFDDLFRDYLENHDADIFESKNDIYYHFYKLGVKNLKNHGSLSYITSRYCVEATNAALTRLYLQNNTIIHSVIDFGNVEVFEGVNQRVIVGIFEKEPDSSRRLGNYVKCRRIIEDWPSDNEDIIPYLRKLWDKKAYRDQYVEVFDFPQSRLDERKWTFHMQDDSAIRNKLETRSTTLGGKHGLCKIAKGMMTGCDEAFIVTPEEISSSNIPKELTRPLLKNENVKRYVLTNRNEYLIFTPAISDIEEQQEIKRHLEKFKDKLLEKYGTRKGKKKWFEYDVVNAASQFEMAEKIVVPYRCPENRFAYDADRHVHLFDVYLIALNPESLYSLKFILAILNSRLMNYSYRRFYGRRKKAEFEYLSTLLNMIPIHTIDFSNAGEKGIHDELSSYAERMIALVQQEYDLIAKLPADKTIALKQVLKESEAFHISRLAPNTHVSDPKTFQKAKIREFEIARDKMSLMVSHPRIGEAIRLGFDDESYLKYFALMFCWWIEEKGMKGFNGDVELPSVFNLSDSIPRILDELKRVVGTDDVLATKKEIDDTDRSIDKIVYKLYGLTPEDVALVEGTAIDDVERKYGW